MQPKSRSSRALFLALGGLGLTLSSASVLADDYGRGENSGGAVYTMSNDTFANAVLIFQRAANGALTPAGSVQTGGRGTGAGLGDQGGLILSDDHRWLIAVNAASNDVSVFAVHSSGIVKVAQSPSGGAQPISVTIDDDLVYVLNAGSDAISGFRLSDNGELVALSGSSRPLSGKGVGPAEIKFSPGGRSLLVSEKATNKLTVYAVGPDGLPASAPREVTSSGKTPFGFDFAGRRTLVVSEAVGGAPNASTVSSYRVGRDGATTLVSASVPDLQTAACWIATTPDGRYAYTTNTGSGSVSGYSVNASGQLAPLNANGVTANTGAGSGPIDMAVAGEERGRFLYVLEAKTHAIGAFLIGRDGSLTPGPVLSGLPASAVGLAAL